MMISKQSKVKTRAVDEGKPRLAWQKWIEPWYLVYALLGAIIAGLIPVLLPLEVGQTGNPAQVGWVMAAVSLGGLSAPIWGALADRYYLHRPALLTGLILTSVSLVAFAMTSLPALWLCLALLLSIGSAGASTVANLFVIERHPQPEWEQRIGWLQTFYGMGQVLGLLLAAYLSGINLRTGILSAAGLGGIAALMGWLTLRTAGRASQSSLNQPVLIRAARHAELTVHSPQRFYHHFSKKSLRQFGLNLQSPYGLFLAIWLLALSGSTAVFSQYPILMQKVFGISAGVSSIGFAVMAGLGLLLYTPAGAWSERFGSTRILRLALIVRILAFGGLFVLGIGKFSSSGWLALAIFALIVLAWSLMSVAGTALAAALSPVGEGEGMGIYNAVNALAGVVGAILGGWVAGSWGYTAVIFVALIGVSLALLLGFSSAAKRSEKQRQSRNPAIRDGRAV